MIPAVVVAIIFSVWEVSLPVAKIIFSIGLLIGGLSAIVDLLFFNIIRNSSRTKAIHLFRKFKEDIKAQHLRSSLRAAVVLAIPVIYIEVSVIYLYAALSYLLTGLVYFSYLGHAFSEDLEDPEDFIDRE